MAISETIALKEVTVLRIRLQSHQVHLTMLQYYTCIQYTVRHKITYTKMNLSRVKWAQWDKTQSRELLVPFIWVCSSLCTIVTHNTAQNRPDNFPSCPPDNHHCSDDVSLKERELATSTVPHSINHRLHHLVHCHNCMVQPEGHCEGSSPVQPSLAARTYRHVFSNNKWSK